MDGDFGGLAPARRADVVLLNDGLEVQNTWYGGELVVERRKITPLLDQALSKPYRYPRAAYAIIDKGQVEFRRVPYDIDQTIRHMRSCGIDENIVAKAEVVLRSGGSPTGTGYSEL